MHQRMQSPSRCSGKQMRNPFIRLMMERALILVCITQLLFRVVVMAMCAITLLLLTDRVFAADESTSQLYNEIAKPLVVSTVEGYNGMHWRHDTAACVIQQCTVCSFFHYFIHGVLVLQEPYLLMDKHHLERPSP